MIWPMISQAKLIRILRGRTQFSVAIEVKIHPSRLSLIENQRVEPSEDELQRLARALGTTPDKLQSAVTEQMLLSNSSTGLKEV